MMGGTVRSLEEEAVVLARAQQGDREAFWELAAPSVDAIYRLAHRLVRSDEDAEDVVQEAYLQALKAIGEFRGHSRFTTWIHRIAVNQALMKLRKRRKDVFPLDAVDSGEIGYPLSLMDWSESALDEVVRQEVVGTLESAIEELPIDLKTVVVLRDVNGLSNEEAAQALDLPIGAVMWRLHRARSLLRDRLTGYFRERQGAKRVGR
jgi:RNA polymerase sigma-70 factor (ECF subfamily)